MNLIMKNPFKRKKKKNPFEASMLIDKPEFKMIEARYNENPFFFAVGTAKQREVKGAGGVGTEGVKGEYQSQKDLEWRIFYNMNALPNGFMPEEKLKEWMAGTVAVTSGSIDVFEPSTDFIESDEEKLQEVKDREDLLNYLNYVWDMGMNKKKRKKTSELK